MLRLLIILLVINLPSYIYAQVNVSGTVSDGATGVPLDNVTVVNKSDTLFITSPDGKFNFSVPGPDKITFSRAGYESLAVIPSALLNIRMQPSGISTEEIKVTAFSTEKSLLRSPGPLSLLTERDFERTNGTRLSSSLNMVPGIRMELKNSLSTSRIIIRGVGSRSNFDTRGVKIYWNDIPLTDASGYSTINGIDAGVLERIEVLKGPSSSLYGSNLAGVLNIRTEKVYTGEKNAGIYGLGGSDGLNRFGVSVKTAGRNSGFYLAYNHQDYRGYRQHARDTKDFITFAGQYYTSPQNFLTVIGNYVRNDFKIPGPLDSIEFINDPRKADLNYINKNAAYRSDDYRGGISNTVRISRNITNTTSFFAGRVKDENPLTYAFIKSRDFSYGGRTVFNIGTPLKKMKLGFIFGGEGIFNDKVQQNFENNSGVAGKITSDKTYRLRQLNFFAQVNADISPDAFFTLGAGYNSTVYNIEDKLKANGVDETGEKSFEPSFSPRAALLYQLNDMIAVHSSVSFGFSPPVISEVYRPDGTINRDIQPEKGVSYELGIRGVLLNNMLSYDVSIFSMTLTGELIPQAVAPNQFVYINSGKTRHNGLELSASYNYFTERSFIKFFKPYISYSYNDFYFVDYAVNGVNYSGSRLTGAPGHYFNAGIDIESRTGIYSYITYNYTGSIPMLDDNSKYSEPYSLLAVKSGIKVPVLRKLVLDIFAGGENLLNENYSAFLMLNQQPRTPGALAKFYNPSPQRSFYGGVQLRWMW
jgi:iron complex outermembrane receptor protein